MEKVFIIAEAGVNHNGSMELAKQLVDNAVEAGADCIKFQTFKTENLICINAPKADYQILNTNNSQSQFEMLKELELSYQQFIELKKYCDEKSIIFLSTPFDMESLDFLLEMNLPLIKIPSGEITNLPYLRRINNSKKNVILSTGMSSIEEIKQALVVLEDCRVSLLHCTTEYPCPFENVNMSAMLELKKIFNLPIGYSDHTEGIEIPIMAVSMGAKIIEKHFTLDKTLVGPDHRASISPIELKQMVKSIRNVEKAFGKKEKLLQSVEKKNLSVARKSIVAACNIKKGEIFTEQNLTTKRPANGISPMMWDKIIGTTANKDYQKDDLI